MFLWVPALPSIPSCLFLRYYGIGSVFFPPPDSNHLLVDVPRFSVDLDWRSFLFIWDSYDPPFSFFQGLPSFLSSWPRFSVLRLQSMISIHLWRALTWKPACPVLSRHFPPPCFNFLPFWGRFFFLSCFIIWLYFFVKIFLDLLPRPPVVRVFRNSFFDFSPPFRINRVVKPFFLFSFFFVFPPFPQ